MANKHRILIFGDIMLDHYVSGKVARISPEAPVPVVKVDKEWSTLGGAANVAANVAALGAHAVLVGMVGRDSAANTIHDYCQLRGIETKLLVSNSPTIVKTRVVSGQQIVRFDREELIVWTPEQWIEFDHLLKEQIAKADIVLLSDYAKGMLSEKILRTIFDAASKNEKRVLVDPKQSNWAVYQGAYLATPNLAELAMTEAGKNLSNDDNQVVEVCNSLRSEFEIENIVATRSSYGMTVVSDQKVLNIPTRAQEVYDVSGAGDTVLATFGVSLAEGKTVSQSAFIANIAAGIVVSKLGTAVVQRSELDSFLGTNLKLVELHAIDHFKKLNQYRKVVFTNGCFDVLHQGHRKLLAEAKQLGDVLVVGLNSDASISRLKGNRRPINGVNQRIEVLSALPFVDAIMVFEQDTPFELLSVLKPDILVKGGDYKKDEVIGREHVSDVVILNLVEGFSTTRLVGQTK